MEFLETQYRIHNAAPTPSTSENPQMIATIKKNDREKSHSKAKDQCKYCKGSHWLFFCPTFENWSVADRLKYVNEKKTMQNMFT